MTEFLGLHLSSMGGAGTLALWLCLLFALYGMVLAVLGGVRHDPRLVESARRATWGVFAFSTLAIGILISAILHDDFSVRYVANHSMTVSPLWVKVVTLWAALEGSILLWAWLLTLYTFILSFTLKTDVLRPWVLASQLLSVLFFIGINLTIASPFTPVVNVPEQGRGPNPLLQNHWMMAVHPVLLYLGFVGCSVPFGYALAALVTGRLGEDWLKPIRTWSMTAWLFLSAAIVAGAWWSYEILGWGGYWAWDAVENASLIPWLLLTAFLHSVQIQERKRMLKAWNIYLLVAAYASTVLGTLITRSGIVESVHAFGNGPVGMVFLGFLAVVLLLGVTLASYRLPAIRDANEGDGFLSREGIFLAGNVVFVTYAVMVLFGTLFPVMVEALRGVRTSVGAPFFNQFAIPLGWLLLLLMGIGPTLPWRRTGSLWHSLKSPVLWGVGVVLVSLPLTRNIAVSVTLGLCAYNLAGLKQLTSQSLKERGLPWWKITELVQLFPRRYGAYLAHKGLLLMAIGIAFSGAYKSEAEVTLNLQKPQNIMGKEVLYRHLKFEDYPEKRSTVATVYVGSDITYPKLNLYINSPQSTAMPYVQYHPLGDTYVTLLAYDPKGQWVTVRLIDSPLVSWIWFGTVIMLLGGWISLQNPRTTRGQP